MQGEVNRMSDMEKGPVETQKLSAGTEAPVVPPRRPDTKKLPPEPGTAVAPVGTAPHLGLTREEMSWAALAHASILVTLMLGIFTGGVAAVLGAIIPALIWYAYRDKSEYVVEQARQATIFQVAGFLGLLLLAIGGGALLAVGWTLSAILVLVLIGLILLLVMLIVTLAWGIALVALPVAWVVYGCYAALEAYNGRPFRYLWVADLIDRYQAQA
jgi:uncharacterized Tic20 family protein